MTLKQMENNFIKKAKSLVANYGKCEDIDCENCFYNYQKLECYTFNVFVFSEEFLKKHKENIQLELDFT